MFLIAIIAAVLLYFYSKSSSTAASNSGSSVSGSTQDNLDNFGQAIFQFEGGNQGDRNVFNNNPGNIKGGSFARKATGVDSKGFSVFASQGDGWDALNNLITTRAQNQPQWNFYDFFNYYLRGSTTANPVDNQGDSTAYANYVANYMGVDPNTTLGSLFGG